MVKLMRRNLDWWAIITATIFLGFQVVCDLSLPNLTSNLINNGVAKGNVGYIWQIGLQMLGLTLVGIFAAAGNVYFASTQAQKMGARLRGKIFKKVLSFGNYEMDKFGSSSLITRTTNDVMQIQNVTIMMLRMMIMAPLMLIGASVMAYFNEKRLTSIFLVSIPILLIAIGCAMYFAVPLFQKLQKQIDRINLIFREGLTGVRVIRAFRQDKFEQERFDKANKDYTETGIKVFSIVSLMFPIMTLVLNVTNMGIIWFGAKLIANHEMQVGNLVAFMTYASMILFSFMMLSMIFVLVPRAEAAAKRINAVLEIENSINDAESEIGRDSDKIQASLEFKNVSFRYRGAEDLALDNLSVDVKAGETLAIIGGTGSGKSTLINLIPRLYDVNSGEVLVDGNDVRKYSLHDLHDKVAFVQQKAVLFKGTIRSNLLIGNPEATEEDMWKALAIRISIMD